MDDPNGTCISRPHTPQTGGYIDHIENVSTKGVDGDASRTDFLSPVPSDGTTLGTGKGRLTTLVPLENRGTQWFRQGTLPVGTGYGTRPYLNSHEVSDLLTFSGSGRGSPVTLEEAGRVHSTLGPETPPRTSLVRRLVLGDQPPVASPFLPRPGGPGVCELVSVGTYATS